MFHDHDSLLHYDDVIQQESTCSKLTVETLEEDVKYVQSYQ